MSAPGIGSPSLPLVLFCPGFAVGCDQYESYGQFLAMSGYVTAARAVRYSFVYVCEPRGSGGSVRCRRDRRKQPDGRPTFRADRLAAGLLAKGVTRPTLFVVFFDNLLWYCPRYAIVQLFILLCCIVFADSAEQRTLSIPVFSQLFFHKTPGGEGRRQVLEKDTGVQAGFSPSLCFFFFKFLLIVK